MLRLFDKNLTLVSSKKLQFFFENHVTLVFVIYLSYTKEMLWSCILVFLVLIFELIVKKEQKNNYKVHFVLEGANEHKVWFWGSWFFNRACNLTI